MTSSASSEILSQADKQIEDKRGLKNGQWIPWTNGGYKIWFLVKRFFQNPYKRNPPDLNLLQQVTILLNSSSDTLSEDNVKICEHLIHLHRITENTSARKRLEKWTNRVIGIYLIVVCLIVIACAFNFQYTCHGVTYKFYLPNEILITILSTTTINIIGLAVILMKGHFPQDNKNKDDKDNKDKNNNNN
ncbi:MAG: hypothetical protein MJ009_00615 [Paludibacteraceae bacterium]|nr:hypothetical protein [Paludibacteraceae bacterium]